MTESNTITLKGGMDLASIHETHALIASAISDGTSVSINCSAVEFFDGATLQLLLVASNTLKQNGESLRLTGVSEDVESSFRLAGALDLISK